MYKNQFICSNLDNYILQIIKGGYINESEKETLHQHRLRPRH